MSIEASNGDGALLLAAKRGFLLLVALLPWMKHGLTIGRLQAYPTDLLFLLTVALWVATLVARQARLRLHPSFLLLAFYFCAMAVSASLSVDRSVSAFKLLTQGYLLLLPVLAYNLVRTEADLRRLFAWWLVPAAAVAAYGVVTVLLFPFFGWHSFLREPLHHFGTLPPGPYPRIELTFVYPAMLANYLGVSLMLLLLARRSGWIRQRPALACAVAMIISAFFALTPGFGGILAMLCLWTWYLVRERRRLFARAALAGALGISALEVLVAAITPIIHSTAPFLIHVPGLAAPLAPAVRLMAWIDAAREFARSPLFGHGIGVDAVSILYQLPEATEPGLVTDAHNFVLSIAAQCGTVGIVAIAPIVWFVVRRARDASRTASDSPLLFGLSIAWLSGFVIEGLVGSFEDSRHLWILFGLIAAVSSFEANRHRPRRTA